MRGALRSLICLALAASGARGAEAPEGPAVQVRTETVAYPVRQSPPPAKYPHLKINPALSGKETYATEAVVLENEHLRAVVLPEFGGRLARLTFKAAGRDLFWVHDVLEDALPWSMGGMRFSFPFYEHGRHLDEGAGCRVVRRADGSVTVAMDQRFRQYAGEVGRYGRFSGLRQATLVTLRPGSAVLEVAARIDNPLPLRHGLRLWSVAHLPRQAGAHVLLPAGGVTDHGAPALRRWPVWDDVDHGVLGAWGTSSFAVDLQGDWCGTYYPDADANHLVLKPRFTAPGTKFYAAPPAGDPDAPAGRGDEMIEMWNGSNPLFEHPGDYLPPFGAYVLPLRLAMVTGIGRVAWAGQDLAIGYRVQGEGAQVAVVGFEARPQCTVMARSRAGTAKVQGALVPGRPLLLDLPKRAEPVLVTVVDGEDNELAEVGLPWKPQPTPDEALKALQAQVRPWTWLAMELSDWPHEHAPNIAEAAKALAQGLSAEKVEQALHAARVVMRTEAPGSERWNAVRGVLASMVSRGAKTRFAPLYLGMMLALEAKGQVTDEAGRHLRQAGGLPGAQYLLGLEAIAKGDPMGASARLRDSAAAAPPVAMGLAEPPLEGNDRLHPAALAGGEWPTLLRAAVLLGMDRAPAAAQALEALLLHDPARPEALLLLAEACTKMNEPGKAAEAREAGEALLRRNDQARRDYEALRREAATGLWSGIPRP